MSGKGKGRGGATSAAAAAAATAAAAAAAAAAAVAALPAVLWEALALVPSADIAAQLGLIKDLCPLLDCCDPWDLGGAADVTTAGTLLAVEISGESIADRLNEGDNVISRLVPALKEALHNM